jgi:hypothetical protein
MDSNLKSEMAEPGDDAGNGHQVGQLASETAASSSPDVAEKQTGYLVHLTAERNCRDSVKSLRRLLKFAVRSCRLRAISVREVAQP